MIDLPPILEQPEGELELLHTRTYEVQVFRLAARELLARAAVRDLKPGSLFLPDDPDPLPVHHMQVELRIEFPSLTITSAGVEFRVFPEDTCPTIVEHYHQLVGLSIGRGFTHKVRELFGGPRGCTHTTALLQAMAPAVVQATFSLQLSRLRDAGQTVQQATAALGEIELAERRKLYRHNINSCHVWDEQGDKVAGLDRGEPHTIPVFIRQRLAQRAGLPDA